MGNGVFKEKSTFKILVKTSDRFGAGTDSGIFLVLHDKNGLESEPEKLDKFFRNDFERGQIDDFKITTDVMDEIVDIEIWRDSSGACCAWHLEYVSVEDTKTKVKNIFPFHRWVEAYKHYFIEAYDCTLPQHHKFVEQRREEMEERRNKYNYKESYPNLPLQIQHLPNDDQFSDQYTWDLGKHKLGALLEKMWIGVFHEDRKGSFKTVDDVFKIFERFKAMPLPKDVRNWKEDAYFGNMRLNGCNPKLIQLCKKVPEKFGIDAETLKPLLEDKTVEEAIATKKLFLVDLTMLEGISTRDGTVVPTPYCLLYLNDQNFLLPVAIQLFKEPGLDNPVYYSNDERNLWILVKMWYSVADSSYHQAASHLGATHLMMEGICVAMNKTMSLSHPIHKLLAPHFLFLLAINDRALSKLVAPGGWIDLTMAIGRIGLFEIVGRRYCNYDIMGEGDLLADLKNRGVEDEKVLPGYHYRDDAVFLYKIINKYVKEMVVLFYEKERDIVEDVELQAWRAEMVRPRPLGLGYKGVPGVDGFSTHDQVTSLLTYIIFSCSVEHAAVNFSQYDSYAFPLAYPVKMQGKPPNDSRKLPKSERDWIATLNNKEHMMNTMIVTRMLSMRGTQALGDFEVVYHYRPDIVAVVEKFKVELKQAADIINRRDAERRVPYCILNPKEVPNAISI